MDVTVQPEGAAAWVAIEAGSFEDLYHREYSRVLGTAYLLTRDREEARDISQETFARAYSSWRKLSDHPSPEAWLQRVTTNLCLSWHRRSTRRRRLPVPAGEQAVDMPEPVEPEIVVALASLPKAQRAVVVLRYFADLSVNQVSEALGKKPGTVKALSSQGLANLRTRLTEEETDR